MKSPGQGVLRGRGLLAAALLAGLTLNASGQVIADSMADFSSTQGHLGWSYGFYDGDGPAPFTAADFEPLPTFDPAVPPGVWYRRLGPGGYWTAINRTAAHPNGAPSAGGRTSEINWAVRRWVSPAEMPVTIHGHCADTGPGGGDGTQVRVVVDGALRYQRTLADGDTAGADFSFDACLNAGDIVDFILTPGPGGDQSDGVIFTATIEGPISGQPESTSACLGGSAHFTVTPRGTGPFRYQWRKDGLDLPGETAASLTVEDVNPEKTGAYSCLVTVFACGSVESDEALLSICAVDYNCDGLVDFADYLDFLSFYDAEDARADLNSDGFVDFLDYLEFVNAFDQGC